MVWSPKKFFFGPQFGLKIRGWRWAPWAPPLDSPLVAHHQYRINFKNIYGDQSGEFVGGYWAQRGKGFYVPVAHPHLKIHRKSNLSRSLV